MNNIELGGGGRIDKFPWQILEKWARILSGIVGTWLLLWRVNISHLFSLLSSYANVIRRICEHQCFYILENWKCIKLKFITFERLFWFCAYGMHASCARLVLIIPMSPNLRLILRVKNMYSSFYGLWASLADDQEFSKRCRIDFFFPTSKSILHLHLLPSDPVEASVGKSLFYIYLTFSSSELIALLC